MKKQLQSIFFVFLFIFWTAFSSNLLIATDSSQSSLSKAIKEFEKFIGEQMALDKVPGLSMGFMKGDFTWAKGFGYSDLENKVTAKPESSYRLASITKTITAIAVLQLAEEAKIDLDAEVQTYVPYFPKKKWPVTIRLLLGHLGGISHYKNYDEEGHIKVHKDTKEALAIFQDFDLVAEPDEGWQFLKWTGDVGTIADVEAAATNITMYDSYSITARFGIELRDWYDLNAIRNTLAGNYILMNDLDSTTAGYEELASTTANQGKGWQPIGFVSPGNDGFTGTLDGQGYEISDLFINRPDENYIGLFGEVSVGGIVQNIGVTSITITGYNYVGGLVGYSSGTVSNSYSTGSVTGNAFVGGLLGYSFDTVSESYSTVSVNGGDTLGGLVGRNKGTVSNSYSTGSVTGDNNVVGGVVGWNSGNVGYSYATGDVSGGWGVGGVAGSNFGNVGYSYSTSSVTGDKWVGGVVGDSSSGSTVSNSYSSGSVYGSIYVGGLVGQSYDCTVSNSYFTGSVTGGDHAGGLVGRNIGWNYDSTVSNCYSTGSVTGNERVGGLVGSNWHSATVSNSYSTGSVTGNNRVGGLVGQNYEGTVSNSFWDTETSGQATSAGGTGKTTAQMKNIATFSGAGWNTITVGGPGERNPAYIWNIVNGVTYPFLSWEP